MSGVVKHWPTWMPFSDFKKHAVLTRALVDDLMNTPYNWVKGRMVRPATWCAIRPLTLDIPIYFQAAGTATQCIAVELLETMNNQTGPYREAETIDEEDVKRITGVVYGGKILCSAVFWGY